MRKWDLASLRNFPEVTQLVSKMQTCFSYTRVWAIRGTIVLSLRNLRFLRPYQHVLLNNVGLSQSFSHIFNSSFFSHFQFCLTPVLAICSPRAWYQSNCEQELLREVNRVAIPKALLSSWLKAREGRQLWWILHHRAGYLYDRRDHLKRHWSLDSMCM